MEKEEEVKKRIKVLVAHPGKQHSLMLAEALCGYQCDIELEYVTTVYDMPKNIPIRIIKKISPKYRQMASSRKSLVLNNNQVVCFCSYLGLFRIFLAHYDKKDLLFTKVTNFLSRRFGKKVAKYAIKKNIDIIIMYDTFSYHAFKYLDSHIHRGKIIKILDASAANVSYQQKIIKSEINKDFAGSKIQNENKRIFSPKALKEAVYEAQSSDFIICASSITKKSYIYAGAKGSTIHICPYGISVNNYYINKKNDGKKIIFTYLSGTKEMKGFRYLMEAVKRIPVNKAEIRIYGTDTIEDEIKQKFHNNIKFVGRVLSSEIPNVLANSDVVIFPSLCDGFGLAAAEGMASGCPIIVSSNAGVSDLVKDNVDGFIITPSSSKDLFDKMMVFINDPNLIKIMGKNARNTIIKYSFELYRKNIYKVIKKATNNRE